MTKAKMIQPKISVNSSLTLREGLERYYQANPEFTRNQDLWVGSIRIPWGDLLRHDLMHVITGYSTALDQELRLIGFLLTALTWRRPWYYYAQSFVVFLEIWGRSLLGRSWGPVYYNPLHICRLYFSGICQGLTIHPKIDAYIDPDTVLEQPVAVLRAAYGIQNAGSWD